MSAMLGVMETSLAGSLMKVLQLEHAGRFTGPNIVFSFPKRPRSGRDPKVRRSDGGAEASRPSPHVQWRAVFLGGVRRSFAVSPWRKPSFRSRQTLTTKKRG